MQIKRRGNNVLIRLIPGEELIESITGWARKNNIGGAIIRGLGAVEDSIVGFFNMEEKAYRKAPVPEMMEIVSLEGNLSMDGKEPVVHLHVVLSSAGGHCLGGHLFKAVVAITAELNLTVFPEAIKRHEDPKTGLHLWNLED